MYLIKRLTTALKGSGNQYLWAHLLTTTAYENYDLESNMNK